MATKMRERFCRLAQGKARFCPEIWIQGKTLQIRKRPRDKSRRMENRGRIQENEDSVSNGAPDPDPKTRVKLRWKDAVRKGKKNDLQGRVENRRRHRARLKQQGNTGRIREISAPE